ncbi:GNAT family N-acetyltransferase [Phaeobacter gallaeciensis]|uniref:GNAT family N-acetyltransferase n=2 Tax=Roseobacteraceae TaxID=2854170 RepID=A0A366WZ67_9RHOB|nr:MULTISPECIES: GNAT family N-acetyltransferase [Roseobacteraceae]MBT3139998.1 GNAT family N-acetyltransferase [Falsiruegeria litorea]MBT8169466.1 GNAT family N-acetyltransferase [Falsiruegeria litorea]RBW55921.1 GNAT family N-acetyltransferase [Phaeobacter gallaeciensis]
MRNRKLPQDLIVRRLYSSDQVDIYGHFLRLDIQSRRARFCGIVSNDAVLKYAQSILQYDSIACGAFAGRHLRGLVELRGLFHSWPSTSEAAFSVEPEWQNIGVGDALFDRMLVMAQNRGVRIIQMMCLKDNSRMRHLAAKHHAQLLLDQEAVGAVLHPNWPTAQSIVQEIIGETRGYSHQLFG